MLWLVVAAILLPLMVLVPRVQAEGDNPCPPGTNPVSVGSGVICVVVSDPGDPGDPGNPGDDGGDSGDGGVSLPVGCYKDDGTEVPCQTSDGTWWSAYDCYAAPYDAQPGTWAWQGHTDGSLWQCTKCVTAGAATSCFVQIKWTAPGSQPTPPTPEELATTVLDQLPLAIADIRTAPEAPAPTYVGVDNWLWIPAAQWSTLTKSVTAGATTVTVTAAPSEVAWTVGPKSLTCDGPGRAWVRGMTDAATTACSLTFDETSNGQPRGAFAVTAVIRYAVTWACSGTCPTGSGDFGLVDAPAGTGELTVLQRQTVVVR